MGGERLVFGLFMALVGCASDEKGDTGSDGSGLLSCGISEGKVFDIQVERVTLAPADSDGNRWDSKDTDQQWNEHLVEWRDLSKTVSTDGAFERGSYDDVETVNEYFDATLFTPTAAPDPVAILYASDDGGETWNVANEWDHLVGNTYQLDGLYLGRWALGGDQRISLQFLDADAGELTRVGELTLTGVIAQSIAQCGPMSVVLSESEMRKQESRVHAIEIAVEIID